MAKRMFYTCDGCDEILESPHPVSVSIINMKITGTSDGVGPKIYDLCGKCESRMRVITNPERWPRKPADGPVGEVILQPEAKKGMIPNSKVDLRS